MDSATKAALDALEAAGKSGACPPWDAATLATNLAAPLAAVVRAAMEYRAAVDTRLNASDEASRLILGAVVMQSESQMFAALDAFNAAAQEMGFK